MKKKIAILGSTGSIGKSTASIISKNKKDFEVVLLTTNKNLKELSKQCKKLKPKFLIINDYKSYLKFRKINQKTIGESTLGGRDIWIDENIGWLNTD